MVEHIRTHDPHAGIRRFLDDLRSGADRRSWAERRHEYRPARTWDGGNRRASERRMSIADRRQPAAGPFGPGDHEHIAAILADPSLPAECPRCHAPLLRSETLRTGRPVPVIHCTGCRRRAEMA